MKNASNIHDTYNHDKSVWRYVWFIIRSVHNSPNPGEAHLLHKLFLAGGPTYLCLIDQLIERVTWLSGCSNAQQNTTKQSITKKCMTYGTHFNMEYYTINMLVMMPNWYFVRINPGAPTDNEMIMWNTPPVLDPSTVELTTQWRQSWANWSR